MPWELRVRRAAGETDLTLAHAVDQQAPPGPPGSGGDPCGLLEPYEGQRRELREPATAGCHRGGLLLLGLETLASVPVSAPTVVASPVPCSPQ